LRTDTTHLQQCLQLKQKSANHDVFALKSAGGRGERTSAKDCRM
jgi:hypothetical protein